jgi:hypothetical protein
MTAMKQNCTRILESRFSNSASVQFEFIEWHSTFENIRGSLATAHPATGRSMLLLAADTSSHAFALESGVVDVVSWSCAR